MSSLNEKDTIQLTIKTQGIEIKKNFTKRIYQSKFSEQRRRQRFKLRLEELHQNLPSVGMKLTQEKILIHALQYIRDLESMLFSKEMENKTFSDDLTIPDHEILKNHPPNDMILQPEFPLAD